ncbi:MAG: DUF2283 domain-containing protein [Kiritimatiellia bacterium]|jgi:uncharacterized protein YuzE|nr:DUF2283 domain-containing protein [Kiritimatiellia bacterium]MDP7024475.1 DUF2283 domain-containing protein [Kiritimatiellia bacterium]
MKVHYDKDVDAIYLRLGDETPDGVSELSEGVNLDTTANGHLVGIEILDASKRFDIRTILSYVLDVDQKVLQPA